MTNKEAFEIIKGMMEGENGYSHIYLDILKYAHLSQAISLAIEALKPPRTNFEKWKAELTLERFVFLIEKTHCFTCPVYARGCNERRATPKCEDALFAWANAEAEEDGNE